MRVSATGLKTPRCLHNTTTLRASPNCKLGILYWAPFARAGGQYRKASYRCLFPFLVRSFPWAIALLNAYTRCFPMKAALFAKCGPAARVLALIYLHPLTLFLVTTRFAINALRWQWDDPRILAMGARGSLPRISQRSIPVVRNKQNRITNDSSLVECLTEV